MSMTGKAIQYRQGHSIIIITNMSIMAYQLYMYTKLYGTSIAHVYSYGYRYAWGWGNRYDIWRLAPSTENTLGKKYQTLPYHFHELPAYHIDW